jgi:hypothetical protein
VIAQIRELRIMSSCMGNVPLEFQAGGVCGGNGHCVNSLVNPGTLLCLCNPGYSGASDFFDNRVEQLPDGRWLSFSCHCSQVGTIIIWSFFLLCGLIRVKQLWPVFVKLRRKHYQDPKKVEQGIFADFALRIISFDLFAMSIPLFISGAGKLAGGTFGTDILVTVAQLATGFLFQVGVFDLTRREFMIIVKGSMNPIEAKKATRFRDVLKCFTLAVFFGMSVIPSLWALSLDKRLGPLDNGEYIVVYLRSFAVVGYGILEIWTTWMIRKRLRKVIENDSELTYIMEKMDAELRAYIIFLSTIGVTFIVFAVPFFFQFQTYAIAFIVGLSALRHSGNAFADEFDKTHSRKNTTKHTGSKVVLI